MKSYEVIKASMEEPGVKAVAATLKVSPALVYKWCEPPAVDGDMDNSGAKNPLDRVKEMYTVTKDIRLVRWLCNQAGGFFVANPAAPEGKKDFDRNIFNETRGMVREYSQLLDEITAALDNDPGIDSNEAVAIRQRWENLKSMVERFVIRCERGHYR